MKTKLYLDIDGVLIGKKNKGDLGYVPANHLKEFLKFSLKNFDCYFLSTHTKSGNPKDAISVFQMITDNSEILDLLSKIKATKWSHPKTEGINLKENFFYIDDNLMMDDFWILEKNKKEKSYIRANTRMNPDDLLRVKEILISHI